MEACITAVTLRPIPDPGLTHVEMPHRWLDSTPAYATSRLPWVIVGYEESREWVTKMHETANTLVHGDHGWALGEAW